MKRYNLNILRQKKDLISRGLLYLLFSFLNRGLPFLLLPVYSRCLTPEDYGIYALFLTAVTISNPFLTLCWPSAIAFIYFNKEFDICRYVSTFFMVSLGLLTIQESLLCLLIFWSLVQWTVPTFLLLAPINALNLILMTIVTIMYQVKERPVAFGTFNLFCSILKAIMNLS